MNVKVSLIGSPAQAIAATRAHWASLSLDETVLDALEANLASFGTLAYARVGDIELFGHTNDSPAIVDLYVPDDELSRWQAPLASAETTTVQATRGELTLPVLADAAIVRPLTPRYVLAGFVLPVEEPNGDAPHVDEWEQRLPGVADGYPLGAIVNKDGTRYVQEGSLAQLPTGNFFVPGTVGSLWRAVSAGGGLDPWDADTTYWLNDRVTDEGEDWINRDASNTGRKPGSTQAGWMRISNRPYEYYHVGNAGYLALIDGEPMQVTDAGRLWQATADGAGNSGFPPSVVQTNWQDAGPAP